MSLLREGEKERGVMFIRVTQLQTAAGNPSNLVEFMQYLLEHRRVSLLAFLLSAVTWYCRITILHPYRKNT